MLSLSPGFFSLEGNVKWTPGIIFSGLISESGILIRGFSSANWWAMVFFGTFLAILDFTEDPDFHLGVPQLH